MFEHLLPLQQADTTLGVGIVQLEQKYNCKEEVRDKTYEKESKTIIIEDYLLMPLFSNVQNFHNDTTNA